MTCAFAKLEALHAIERLPDDASPFDEIVYRLYVLGKVQQGLKVIDAGRTVSAKDSPTNAKAVVRDILARCRHPARDPARRPAGARAR